MNQAIVRGIILLLGILVAFIVGSATANYDVIFLMLGAICFGALLFVGVIWRYVLPLALFTAMVGLSWYPMGVALGPDELSYLLVVCLIVTRIWRPFDSRPTLDGSTEKALKLFIRVGSFWVFYVLFELVWRLLEVRFYAEPGMKNVLKSYVSILIPTFCWIYFAVRPSGIVTLRNAPKVFLSIMLASLVVGVVLRMYQIAFGSSVLDDQTGRLVAGPFVFQPLWIVEGMYVLRGIGPLGVLAGMLFLTLPRKGTEFLNQRMFFLPLAVVLAGLLGCLVSGGRASIALAGMFIIGVLMLRRSFLAIIGVASAFILVVLTVNATFREVESITPPNILRSINWMIIDGDSRVSGDIDSSTRWRSILFEESIKEWRSSWRNTLIGRGFQGFADTDYMDVQQAGYYEMIDIALQRGATHSLLSDALLCFGVIGAGLYYFFLGTQIFFGLRVTMDPLYSSRTKCFAWIVAIAGAQGIVVGTLGGSFLYMINSLTILILILECYKEKAATVENEVDQTDESQEEPRRQLSATLR